MEGMDGCKGTDVLMNGMGMEGMDGLDGRRNIRIGDQAFLEGRRLVLL